MKMVPAPIRHNAGCLGAGLNVVKQQTSSTKESRSTAPFLSADIIRSAADRIAKLEEVSENSEYLSCLGNTTGVIPVKCLILRKEKDKFVHVLNTLRNAG
jgi:hypothetical protein